MINVLSWQLLGKNLWVQIRSNGRGKWLRKRVNGSSTGLPWMWTSSWTWRRVSWSPSRSWGAWASSDHDHEEHEHHHEHDHEEHEHHHDHDCCGHDHHHHHADEVFTSWGKETPKKFTEEGIRAILDTLSKEDSDEYGIILRAKGIVPDENGKWIHFDLVPGEDEVRYGSAEYTGRICVIGSKLNEDKLQNFLVYRNVLSESFLHLLLCEYSERWNPTGGKFMLGKKRSWRFLYIYLWDS